MNAKKIVLCSLFTALTTVATMVIQIPLSISGYINFGDVFVLLGAFILGPIYGAVSAGVGAMLADILTGFVIYAPGTLIIKAVMAIVAFFLFKAIKGTRDYTLLSTLIAGLFAEMVMVFGYFVYSALIMGEGLVAAGSIPGNLIQGGVSLVLAVILTKIIFSLNIVSKLK